MLKRSFMVVYGEASFKVTAPVITKIVEVDGIGGLSVHYEGVDLSSRGR